VPAPHPSALNPLDPHGLLAGFGTIGIFVVLVAETGLLVGIFLPGDSLLFTAGLLCATSTRDSLHLSLPTVLVAAIGGSLVGAEAGYLLGRRAGPALLARRPDTRLAAAMRRGQAGLQRYGPAKALVLARFVPFLRTVINPLAGLLGVDAKTFTLAQVAGGVLWSAGVTVAGYVLGSRIPNIDHYLLPIIALVVVVSLIPVAIEVFRARRTARALSAERHEDVVEQTGTPS
jgi:membrane-associated protein